MINSLRKIQAWHAQREQRSLEQWLRIRAKGKVQFVSKSSLTFGLAVVGLTDLLNGLFGAAQHSISLRNVIYYVLFGIPVSLIGWWNMETKYRHALHEARVPALSSGERTLQNDALRITSD